MGQALDLALVWRVQAPPADDVILFAGLFDAQGRRWAQTDDRPLGSLLPPSAWPARILIRTPLRLAVLPGTPPGSYRLEIGWYQFVDGQPRWLPWTAGDRLLLGEVTVVAPDDWQALPLPEVDCPAGVTIGRGLELVGLSAPSLSGRPGDALSLDLFWRALGDTPEAGTAVLRLSDDAGQVMAEAPLAGQVPLAAGQVIRDPGSMELPAGLAPGVYNLLLGRRRSDGSWLPVRRGPVGLGSTYPLATVRVVGRSLDLNPPSVRAPRRCSLWRLRPPRRLRPACGGGSDPHPGQPPVHPLLAGPRPYARPLQALCPPGRPGQPGRHPRPGRPLPQPADHNLDAGRVPARRRDPGASAWPYVPAATTCSSAFTTRRPASGCRCSTQPANRRAIACSCSRSPWAVSDMDQFPSFPADRRLVPGREVRIESVGVCGYGAEQGQTAVCPYGYVDVAVDLTPSVRGDPRRAGRRRAQRRRAGLHDHDRQLPADRSTGSCTCAGRRSRACIRCTSASFIGTS